MNNRLGVVASVDQILAAERCGFEFLEGNLSELAVMDERTFRKNYERVHESGLRVEAFGCMLPRELSVTGRGVNATELHAYLDFAFGRAKRLGAEIIGFSSAGARQVPENFPFDVAWRQLLNFLRILERHAADYSLTIAVEPLSRGECNLLSTVSEAMLVCSVLQLEHVKVLADTYHMAMEHESLEVLKAVGPMLRHVHVANAIGRTFPRAGDGEDYRAIFAALGSAKYEGRVCVEAAYDHFEEDAARAYQALDAARKAT
ncbi:MAG: sugar phosphate isomerase/epimerase family protein [Clostridia bacterium]